MPVGVGDLNVVLQIRADLSRAVKEFPARAGMNPQPALYVDPRSRVPRPRGDEPRAGMWGSTTAKRAPPPNLREHGFHAGVK